MRLKYLLSYYLLAVVLFIKSTVTVMKSVYYDKNTVLDPLVNNLF
jgi:hypothetical protein